MLPSQALFLLCHLDNDLVLTINHYIYIFIYSEVHPVPTACRPLIRLSHGVQPPPGCFNPLRFLLSASVDSSTLFVGLLFCGTALMPRSSRSAEEKSRRAEEDRDRRAAESPASRQARLASNSEKKRERRAAESPASRQARLASDKAATRRRRQALTLESSITAKRRNSEKERERRAAESPASRQGTVLDEVRMSE